MSSATRAARKQVEAIERLVAEQVGAVEHLEAGMLRPMLDVLNEAKRELQRDLRKWLRTVEDPTERFTAHHMRVMLRSIEGAISKLGVRLQDWIEHRPLKATKLERAALEGMRAQQHKLGALAVKSLDSEIVRLGHVFGQSLVGPQLDVAAVVARGDHLMMRRFPSSAARYSMHTAEDLRFQIAVGVARGETFEQLVQRLRRIGGPTGPIAVRGIFGTPGAIIEDIPEGLFRRYRHFAERFIRTECIIGSSPITGAVIHAAFRRWYQGDVIHIITAHGRKLTATPNHPVLTQSGWKFARDLQMGDYLICDGRYQRSRTSSYEHVTRGPAPIGEIFDALNAIGIRERRRGTEPDFHGDGKDGDVDIASASGQLTIGTLAALTKPSHHHVFAPPDLADALFCPLCKCLMAIDQGACRCRIADDRAGLAQPTENKFRRYAECGGDRLCGLSAAVSGDDIAGRDLDLSSRMKAAAFGEVISSGGKASRYASAAQNAVDGTNAQPHALGDRDCGFAGEIEIDRVLFIERLRYEGHVYNLSTADGYYAVDGIYTGNCMKAYNTMHDASIKLANDERRPGSPKFERRCDETMDGRTCAFCKEMHGKILRDNEGPPWHSNCRGVTLAWRADWPEL